MGEVVDEMAMAKKMNFATSTYIGITLVSVGVIGNILSILVWIRPKMRSSTGTYLVGLAIADMGLLVFFFITDTIPMIEPAIHTKYAYGVFFSYIGYPMSFLFVVLSIWYTVGVTVDRYIQVCWLSYSKELCNVRRALTGLGIITLLGILVNIPNFVMYDPVPLEEHNATSKAFKPTKFGAGEGSLEYEFWVHCMFLSLAPFATIFVLNMLIIRRVTKINRHMDSKRGEAGKEKARRSEAQMIRLLLTVTFAFLFLIGFQCITQCFYIRKKGNYRIVSEAFAIAKLGVVINSSINFFLYCLSAKRFRKELMTVVCLRFQGYKERLTLYSLSNSSSFSVKARSGLSTKSSAVSINESSSVS